MSTLTDARLDQLSQRIAVARSISRDLFRTSSGRRRLLILLATALVLSYAAGVLYYVLTIPEIGTRTAFTPVVNQFQSEFLYP
jgi:hypothetical protein